MIANCQYGIVKGYHHRDLMILFLNNSNIQYLFGHRSTTTSILSLQP